MTFEPGPLARDTKIYIAGHRGLVGSAMQRLLEREGFTNLIGRTSAELDLRDRDAVYRFFDRERPDVVVLAAAKVGGIVANSTYPADFISDNLLVQVNVLDAAHRFGTRRLVFLGSSCIYPRLAPNPIREDALLTGPLEPTNDAYAIAKIAGVIQVQALRRQYGASFISAMPTNLYGPNDSYDPESSHVVPGLIQKMHAAKVGGESSVTLWGSGSPRRELLHVDDAARALLHLLERYDGAAPVNVGAGQDIAIRDLATLVADVVGFVGELRWDTSRPDGTPQKLLDISTIEALGWKADIDLADGLRATYLDYLAALS